MQIMGGKYSRESVLKVMFLNIFWIGQIGKIGKYRTWKTGIFKWFLKEHYDKKNCNFLRNWSQEKKKIQPQDLRLLFDHKTCPGMIIIIDVYEALSMCSDTSLSTL